MGRTGFGFPGSGQIQAVTVSSARAKDRFWLITHDGSRVDLGRRCDFSTIVPRIVSWCRRLCLLMRDGFSLHGEPLDVVLVSIQACISRDCQGSSSEIVHSPVKLFLFST